MGYVNGRIDDVARRKYNGIQNRQQNKINVEKSSTKRVNAIDLARTQFCDPGSPFCLERILLRLQLESTYGTSGYVKDSSRPALLAS